MMEYQARTKWCPYARTDLGFDVGNATVNRGHCPDSINWSNTRCIASDCMAWRATDNEIKENPQSPVEDGMARDASDYVSAGYCGLSGKP